MVLYAFNINKNEKKDDRLHNASLGCVLIVFNRPHVQLNLAAKNCARCCDYSIVMDTFVVVVVFEKLLYSRIAVRSHQATFKKGDGFYFTEPLFPYQSVRFHISCVVFIK